MTLHSLFLRTKQGLRHIHFALDVEMNQPSEKIIQVGVVCGDLEKGIVSAELKLFVNPKERLHPKIAKLTGIKEYQLKNCICETLHTISEFIKLHGCLGPALIWGNRDVFELSKQTEKECGRPKEDLFKTGWVDVKAMYYLEAKRKGLKAEISLAMSMRALGLTFYGRKHDALVDARNTFILAHHLLNTR